MRGVVTLGGLVPLCAMAYLAWQGQAALGFCTLGVYMMQLFAQIKCEGIFIRKGVTRHLAGLHFSHSLWPSHAHGLVGHGLVMEYDRCCCTIVGASQILSNPVSNLVVMHKLQP